jgi:hypothetical protein
MSQHECDTRPTTLTGPFGKCAGSRLINAGMIVAFMKVHSHACSFRDRCQAGRAKCSAVRARKGENMVDTF